MEDVTTTRPWPLASSAGMHACTMNMVPLTLQSKTASTSCSVISASDLSGKAPALAQSTSMPPNRSTAVSAMRRQSATLDTSAATVSMRPSPSFARSDAAVASPASSRAASSTFAPERTNTRAIPLPMPLLPPVTTTDRPVSGVNTHSSSVVARVSPC
jgi:hypothetical protein